MEKLPEKYCVSCENKDQVCEVSVWYSKNYGIGGSTYSNPSPYPTSRTFDIDKKSHFNRFGQGHSCNKYPLISFKDWKRLVLGEKEEWVPKVGEIVMITSWTHAKLDFPSKGTIVSTGGNSHMVMVDKDHHGKRDTWSFKTSEIRPLLPHEIPQEEVEYRVFSEKFRDDFTIGKIYKGKVKDKHFNTTDDKGNTRSCILVNTEKEFIPSTRAAYEAQERGGIVSKIEPCEDCGGSGLTLKAVLLPSGHSEQTIECPTCNGEGEIETVNKFSQLNTNKNEHTKEKSSEVKSNLDTDTRTEAGQSIRLRTPGGRIVCESGLPPGGKEITRTLKSNPRTKAEAGRRFI